MYAIARTTHVHHIRAAKNEHEKIKRKELKELNELDLIVVPSRGAETPYR